MKIVSWNINSVRFRIAIVEQFLREAQPDILCLQETKVVDADFPFLGACFGVGVLGSTHGGVVDRTFGEPPTSIEVTQTEAGQTDPLLAGIPSPFHAIVGHKEA